MSATIRRCFIANTASIARSGETVTITATLDATGETRDARLAQQDQERAAADPAFRAFAEAAERALLDPECSKLPVPASFLSKPANQLTFRFGG